MIAAGLWEARSRQLAHPQAARKTRGLRPPVQLDTSVRRLDRSSGEIVVIAMIDDVPSGVFGRFFPREPGRPTGQSS